MADLSLGLPSIVPSEHVEAPVGKPAGERSATSAAPAPGLSPVAMTSTVSRPGSSHLSGGKQRPYANPARPGAKPVLRSQATRDDRVTEVKSKTQSGVVRAQIFGVRAAAREVTSSSPRRKYFLFWSSKTRNAFSLADLPISRSPCEIFRDWRRPTSKRMAPKALSAPTARLYLQTTRKFLRFGLRRGSPFFQRPATAWECEAERGKCCAGPRAGRRRRRRWRRGAAPARPVARPP